MNKYFTLLIICLLVSVLSAQAEWGRAPDEYIHLPLANGTNICSDGNGGCWAVCDGGGILHVDRNGNFSWDEAILVIPDRYCWDPQPVLAENGDVIIAMSSAAEQDSVSSVYLQRINLDQERLWGEEGIPLDTFSRSEYVNGVYPGPSDDTYLIHWRRHYNNFSPEYPRLQLINGDGEYLWDVGGIGFDWPHSNSYFTITSDQCVIVTQNVYPVIAVVKIEPDGQQVWDTRISVLNDSVGSRSVTDIESDQNGGAILTYEYLEGSEDDNLRYYGINAIRISSEGDSLWRSEIYEHEIERGRGLRQGNPMLNYAGFGRYFIAWTHWPHSFQVMAIDVDGELLWDEPVDIILDPAGYGRLDAVNSDCGVCYLWVDTDPDREESQAYLGQRININGERLWGDRGQAVQARSVLGNRNSNTTDCNGGVITEVEERPTLQMINRNGELGVVLPVSVKKKAPVTMTYSLIRAYPNPFNSQVTLSFTLPFISQVYLSIHDLQGRTIKQWSKQTSVAGANKLIWEASDVSSGVYFAELVVRNGQNSSKSSRKLVLLR